MRLKNIKGASEKILLGKYFINNPNEYKGKWHELFKNNNPIYIEIGMGKGNFIIKNALTNPDINYIGIEMYDSVILRAVEKTNELELNNLYLIRMDARLIEEVFDKEIDLIYLNFSDPWPKDRHAKRRLTSPRFLARYDKIFKEYKGRDVSIEFIEMIGRITGTKELVKLADNGRKDKVVNMEMCNAMKEFLEGGRREG